MPMTQNDSVRTLLGAPVVIAVLANDSSAGLTITGYTQPIAGTLALNADQSFTYTPNAGFEGIDEFGFARRFQADARDQGHLLFQLVRVEVNQNLAQAGTCIGNLVGVVRHRGDASRAGSGINPHVPAHSSGRGRATCVPSAIPPTAQDGLGPAADGSVSTFRFRGEIRI